MTEEPSPPTARRFLDQVCLDPDASARVVEDLVPAGGQAEVRALDLTDAAACDAAVVGITGARAVA